MPRRAAITHPALRAIAQDQRYAPKEAAQRAVERIEALASEIDAGAVYPRDYIVFRVTSYRSDDAAFELVPGAALLEDLSALAETLCSQARLDDGAMPKGALDLEALCERWGVSRRTVERDRRRGLIARRLRDDAGHERLVFTPDVVRSFERSHQERAAGGASPKRVTEEERALILRRAERYEQSLDMSRHAIAGRLALRLERSVSAVRRVLDAADERETVTIEERAQRVMLGLWERGVTLEDLAQRFSRTRTTAHRVVLRARLQRVLDAGAPAAPERPDGERGALDDAAIAADVLTADTTWPRTVEGVLELAERWARVPAADERALALAARASHRRARTLARSLPEEAPPAHLVDRAETDLRWSIALTTRLAALEAGLVVRSIEDRAGVPLLDLDERLAARLIEVGMERVREAAERFDATRGGRLAGAASLAVDRAIVGVLERETERRESFSAARLDDVVLGAWMNSVLAPARTVIAPPWLLAGLDRIDEDARGVVVLRYGLQGERPRTVLEIAEMIGTSPGGVWSAYRRAVRGVRRG